MESWDYIIEDLAARNVDDADDVFRYVDEDDGPSGMLAAWLERQRGMETDDQLVRDALDYLGKGQATRIINAAIGCSGNHLAPWAELRFACKRLAARDLWLSVDAYRLMVGDPRPVAQYPEHSDAIAADRRALAREYQP